MIAAEECSKIQKAAFSHCTRHFNGKAHAQEQCAIVLMTQRYVNIFFIVFV